MTRHWPALTAALHRSALTGKSVDRIDATDDTLSLTVAQYKALGTVALTANDAVTLADSGSALAGLTALEIGALAAKGIDYPRRDGRRSCRLSVAQYKALGTVILTPGRHGDPGRQVARH